MGVAKSGVPLQTWARIWSCALFPRPLCSLAGSLHRLHVASSSQGTDLHPCEDISAELCCFCLEACQGPRPPGPLVWPHAFRQTRFMLEEWGSEFSPRKLGAPVGIFSTALCSEDWGHHALSWTIWESAKQDKELLNSWGHLGWPCPARWVPFRLMEWKEHWSSSQRTDNIRTEGPGYHGVL